MKQIFSFVSIALLLMAFGLKLSAQQDCASAVDISSLPYSATGLTTTGMENNYSSTDACNSTAMNNEEYVFSFTPTEDMQINIALSNTSLTPTGASLAAKIGLFITEGCPDIGTCLASIDTESANPSLSDINLTSGTTYYIIISSSSVVFLAPTTNVNFDISITKNLEDDLGVTSIEDLTSECGLGNNEIISCNIKNFGLSPQTGFDVTFTINEASPITETYSGTIAPGTSASYTFTSTANLSSIGEYIIHVYTNIAGDENTLNDGTTITIVNMPIYSEFPITEDFESGTGYWSTGGTASSWQHGNPDELIEGLIINTAASGDNIWVTNLAGNTNTGETSYIESPCYDLTSIYSPILNLNYWAAFSLYGNSASVKASIDGGQTWDITITNLTSTTEWKNININMPSLAGQSNVKFRINYTSGFLADNGIAIDDFTIKENILNDLGVTAILTPNTSCGLSNTEVVRIEVANFGAQNQTNVPVNYSIDGGATWLAANQTIASIVAGDTVEYMFSVTAGLALAGEYEIVAKTNHIGDEDSSNDEFQKIVLSQNTITFEEYSESFESGAAGWYAYGTNSTMELAEPSATLINSAGDGDFAWVTNADGFNNTNETSYLESPCFNFSDMVNPKIKVMIQYETPAMMSNFYLESSIDGIVWDTVVAGLVSVGWYGTDLLSFGTWNGSSAGWIQVSTDMPNLAGQSSVKLRFAYKSGAFSIGGNTEGVAIDMINIFDCNVFPSAEFTYTTNGTTISFLDESENAETWSWNFGDNSFLPSTSTEQNPSFTYTTSGQYYVSLVVTNECSSSEYGTTIDVATLTEIINAENISAYPNPASSFLNISHVDAKKVEIIDTNGKIVFVTDVDSDNISIDVRNLSSGNYFLRINESIVSFIKE